MNDETIFDQTEVKNEPNDAQQNQQNQETTTLNSENKTIQPQSLGIASNKVGVSKAGTVAASVASAAAGVGATFGGRLIASEFFPEEPEDDEEIDDEPDEDEEELDEDSNGEGKELEDEMADNADGSDSSSSIDLSIHVTGHDMAIAWNVNDDMSFGQAFAAARREVGAGGVFEWHGHAYGTYYKEEWDAMSEAEKHQYFANVDHTVSHMDENPHDTTNVDDHLAHAMGNHADTTNMEPDDDEQHDPSLAHGARQYGHGDEDDPEPIVEPEPNDGMAEREPDEEPLVEPEPDENGMAELMGDSEDPLILNDDEYAQLDPEDGENLMIDPENEGEVYLDDDELLSFDMEESLPDEEIELNDPEMSLNDDADPMVEDEIYDLDDVTEDDILASNPDVDNLASVQFDPEVTIDNNMDMGEFV